MATTDIFLALSSDGCSVGGADQASKGYGSGDVRCPGAIEVLSFEHEIVQHGSQAGGRPRSVEYVEHGDFVITKAVDAFSPLLFRICCGATYVGEAKLLLYSAVGGWENNKCPEPFLIYTMSYVHISKVSPSGGSGVPTETIGLKYGQLQVKHQSTKIERDWSQVLEAPVTPVIGSDAGDFVTSR